MSEQEASVLHDNAELIYEYTKEAIKNINDGINRKINRLGATLGLCAGMLKFAGDMPTDRLYFFVRLLICGCLLISIASCIAGLLPMQSGDELKPKALLKPHIYRATEEQYRITIINEWIQLIPSLDEISERRGACLRLAFVFLTSAIIILCISIAAP